MKRVLVGATAALAFSFGSLVLAADEAGKKGERGAGFKKLLEEGNGKITKEAFTKFFEARAKEKGKEGKGAIVGPKMRYAHSADFVRSAIAEAGLTLVELTRASSRTENRAPVPGLLVLARR